MKDFLKSLLLLATVCCLAASCGDDNGPDGPDGGDPPPTSGFEITPFEKLNQGTATVNSHAAADVLSHSSLKVNYRSYIALGTDELGTGATNPIYPRIARMKSGNYILTYNQNQTGQDCYYTISSNLKLWEPKGKIFASSSITNSNGQSDTRAFATTDVLVLANGDILAVASYRARDGGYRNLPRDAGLMLKRSTDGGQTWGQEMQIYQGVNWEPFLIQLANGDIHCYFTDSSRTGDVGKDTGTVLVMSTDNGHTWTPTFGSAPYYVIRQSYFNTEGTNKICYNDQMPGVIQLNETGELAAVVETARPAPASNYDISFAYSGPDGTFPDVGPDGVGPTDRNDKVFAGAAPTIGQFPSGETYISYSGMNIRMGDARARNFPTSNASDYKPFEGLGSGGFWGGTHVSDAHNMIVALHTSDQKMRVAQVALNHRITATTRTVTVDGNNSEWAATDEAVFVGAKSQAQATLRCSADTDNIYFLVEVLDRDITDGDNFTVYMAPTGSTLSANETFRIKVGGITSPDLTITTESYNGSSWATNPGIGAVVKTKYENSKNDKGGYRAEISIPRSSLTITSGEMLINLALNNVDTEGSATEDTIADIGSPAKWIPVNGL